MSARRSQIHRTHSSHVYNVSTRFTNLRAGDSGEIFMAKGDHLIVPMGPITHHGIDLGDGTVVHWSSGIPGEKNFFDSDDLAARQANSTIRQMLLADFGDFERVTVREYDSGFDPDVVVARALSRVGETGYCVHRNNCEHFATWCKIDVHESAQVRTWERRVYAVASKSLAKVATRFFAKIGAKFATKAVTRAATPLLFVSDAAQLAVELGTSRLGATPKNAEIAGRATGCASSVGIGALVGGPIGAAVGLGIWALGEAVGEWCSPAINPVDVDETPKSPGETN